MDTVFSIEGLAKFLAVYPRPRNLATIQCLGVFRDEDNLRYGFVYDTPDYIKSYEIDNAAGEGSMSGPRMPRFLASLIGDATATRPRAMIDLGTRFEIAKKLAQSLYVLHACSWVHKK